MRPSDLPESNPLLGRTPPRPPPAPPTTGDAGDSGEQGWKRGRLVIGSGGWQVLVVSLLTVAVAAWLISLQGVAGGLIASSPVVLLASRFRFIRFPFVLGIAAAVVGAVASSIAIGNGTLLVRLLAGVAAGLMITPVVVLGTTLRFFQASHFRASA